MDIDFHLDSAGVVIISGLFFNQLRPKEFFQIKSTQPYNRTFLI